MKILQNITVLGALFSGAAAIAAAPAKGASPASSAPPPTPAREAPGNQGWKSNFLAIIPRSAVGAAP
jgi:hypothetical protein